MRNLEDVTLPLVSWDETEGLAWCLLCANGDYVQRKAEWRGACSAHTAVGMPSGNRAAGHIARCEYEDEARVIRVAISPDEETRDLLRRGFLTALSVSAEGLAFSDTPRSAEARFCHVKADSVEIRKFASQKGNVDFNFASEESDAMDWSNVGNEGAEQDKFDLEEGTNMNENHFKIAAQHHRALADVHDDMSKAHNIMASRSSEPAITLHKALAAGHRALQKLHKSYADSLTNEGRLASISEPTPLGVPPNKTAGNYLSFDESGGLNAPRAGKFDFDFPAPSTDFGESGGL